MTDKNIIEHCKETIETFTSIKDGSALNYEVMEQADDIINACKKIIENLENRE